MKKARVIIEVRTEDGFFVGYNPLHYLEIRGKFNPVLLNGITIVSPYHKSLFSK